MKPKPLLIAVLAMSALAVAIFYFAVETRRAPIRCTKRISRVGNGYVVCVKNKSENSLSLWIKTEEKQDWFNLSPDEQKKFGWLEGFHFGTNSSFSIGGQRYSSSHYSIDSLGDCLD